MLSGVPGLLTFTMVRRTNDVLERVLELPTFVQVTLGLGFPVALHVSTKSSPSTTMTVLFEIFTDGATTSKLNEERL